MRRASAFVLGAVVVLAGMPFGARGHHVDHSDPDDTRGVLDVELVDALGTIDRPAWRIVTYHRWLPRRIWDSGYFTIFVDSFGGTRPDYFVLIRSIGSSMKASLFRDYRIARDRRIRRLRVWRTDRRSVTTRIALDHLLVGEDKRFLRWHVVTLNNEPCPRTCLDRVPDTGQAPEPLPAPTPTETPPP